MEVVVKPYLFLREKLGFKVMTIQLPDQATVGDLLGLLEVKEDLYYPGGAAGLVILVDGRSVKQLSGLETPLHEGAVVSLFPPAAGG